jgi:hypothetical protein
LGQTDDLHAVAAQRVRVFFAGDLFVVSGANTGDGLDAPDPPLAGDVYELDSAAQAQTLALSRPVSGAVQCVAEGSRIGQPGQPVTLVRQMVLMAPDGQKLDLLVLRIGEGVWALPLSPIAPRLDYTVLTVETPESSVTLSDLLCLSFHRGTRITLASGLQAPIERIEPGTLILTRDNGPQPLRWVGKTVLRAVGSFAPVVIGAGVMGNEGDLVVGPHHRLFIYQRKRIPGTLRSELLVQAQHLVNDDTVYRRTGGVAEYFSLVFDRHEIIYAEGLPVESLLVTKATVDRLPPDLAEDVRHSFPGLSHVQHFAEETGEDLRSSVQSAALGRHKPRR